MKRSPVDSRLRAYLLGELPEADRDAMETEVFTDKETFYRLSEIEDRLIDDYARGRLSGEEKLKFEQLYLSNPARRQRVEFALTMTGELDRQPDVSPSRSNAESTFATTGITTTGIATTGIESRAESRSWWYSFLESLRQPRLAWTVAAASLVLLIAGGFRMTVERADLHAQLTQLRLANEAAAERQRALESQLAAAQTRNGGGQLALTLPTPTPVPAPTGQPPAAVPAAFTFTLNVFSLRSETEAAASRITLPAGTTALRLQLPLTKNDFPRYQISLRDSGARTIFKSRKLKAAVSANDVAIFVNIPASQLTEGDYLLTLEGISGSGEIEPVGKKQFTIERQ